MSGYQRRSPIRFDHRYHVPYPNIGNYGVAEEAMESDRIWARAVIMRAAMNTEDAPGAERGWLDWLTDCGIAAISEVDTRALVRHIRDAGSMRGGVFPASLDESQARERIIAEPSMHGLDLARVVTPKQMSLHGSGRGPRIAVIDTGIKSSIVRNLVQRGAVVQLHPCGVTAPELLAADADLFFLANGPGDPAALGQIVETVRELVGKRPVWGICLGHQLLCRAVGLETYKLPFGHRGANHPVKDLETGRIDITSQNHVRGKAAGRRGAAGQRRDGGDGRPLRHRGADNVNLYTARSGAHAARRPALDRTYHTEAGPGPKRQPAHLDRFMEAAA